LKIKRFFAKDMRTALLQVKGELGDDAVIMSNKKVAGGVEIVAAVDGEGSNGAANNYSSSPRHNSSRPTQSKPQAPSPSRALAEDKVSLQSQSGADHSMTKRFANMFKQYGGGDSSDSKEETSADTLAALLNRQSAARQDGREAVQLKEDSPLARLIAEDRRLERPAAKLDPTRYERSRPNEAAVASEDLEEMKEEMTSIRRLLEHQVSGLMWQEVERREPLRAMLIKRLERMGVSSDLADQLACYIPEDTAPTKAWKALLGLVADQVPVSQKDILKRGGVVALLGPTGVGKTTTIAKLAARAAMEYGSDNVALVSTDTYRIGAHEQFMDELWVVQ
jgi:flagellar biosynthesis protein FlhF